MSQWGSLLFKSPQLSSVNRFKLSFQKKWYFIFPQLSVESYLLPHNRFIFIKTLFWHILAIDIYMYNWVIQVLFLVTSSHGHMHMTYSPSLCSHVYSFLFSTYFHHIYVCVHTCHNKCPPGSGVVSVVSLMPTTPSGMSSPRREGKNLSSLYPT